MRKALFIAGGGYLAIGLAYSQFWRKGNINNNIKAIVAWPLYMAGLVKNAGPGTASTNLGPVVQAPNGAWFIMLPGGGKVPVHHEA